ncbi:DUF4386 domain-containing protein [Phycicoccus avicenniae]|uniref:DUF4386 domain-containing protein n=1 Tax=Phycicoccus avicenniae TaxID=2828860 RepID=UPI003D27ADCA
MTDRRTTARLAGGLFLLTHVTSVGAVLLYGPGGTDPAGRLGGRGPVLAGALLEVVLAVAVVGTAVALYPLVRERGHGSATAYVALRTLEAAVILTGVVALLPVVADPGSAATAGLDPGVARAFVGVHAWTFLVGPGLVCPVNTVVLAWLLHRDHLVPRPVTLLGLVGGPLIGLVNLAVLAGLTSTLAVAALPIFAWEVSLAVVLITRGLPTAPVRTGDRSRTLAPTG